MAAYGTQLSYDLLEYAKNKNAKIVDLRSDTLTVPTECMRRAMYTAEVGDDVYGEDPTVKKLEKLAANMLGKEDALFVASGTMGNLIAVMNHCDVRGSEAYCGSECHIFIHEQGGAAQIGGVTLCPIPNEPDGTFDLKKLENCIRKDRLHEPISKLVLVENTLNGKVLPIEWIKQVSCLAKKHNLKIHLDGARFWNAVSASNVSSKELAQYFDSICFCLSKGLGAPVGSLLCGTKNFVEKARRIRKALGGGMRQVGVLAAAGIVALTKIIPLLQDDHRRAYTFAEAINHVGWDIGFRVDMKTVQTNIIFLNIRENVIDAKKFLQRLEEVNNNEQDKDRIIVRGLALGGNSIRLVFHHQINDSHLVDAIKKTQNVILSCRK